MSARIFSRKQEVGAMSGLKTRETWKIETFRVPVDDRPQVAFLNDYSWMSLLVSSVTVVYSRESHVFL